METLAFIRQLPTHLLKYSSASCSLVVISNFQMQGLIHLLILQLIQKQETLSLLESTPSSAPEPFVAVQNSISVTSNTTVKDVVDSSLAHVVTNIGSLRTKMQL